MLILSLTRRVIRRINVTNRVLQITTIVIPLNIHMRVLRPLKRTQHLIINESRIRIFVFQLSSGVFNLYVMTRTISRVVRATINGNLTNGNITTYRNGHRITLQINIRTGRLFTLITRRVNGIENHCNFSTTTFFRHGNCRYYDRSLIPRFVV